MKNLAKLLIMLLSFVLCCSAFVGCSIEANKHVCQHVCSVCGKCQDETCDDPVCKDKCQGHSQTQTHTVTIVGALKASTVQVADGEKVTKPADPTKSGYTFLGWYVDDTEYDWETPVTQDITITAKFDKLFDVRNGSAVKNEDGSYTTTSGNTLFTLDQKFTKGTLIGKVTPGTKNDCGIIFGGAEVAGSTTWWESDAHYITVLVNFNGTVLVSNIDGKWPADKDVYVYAGFENTYNPQTEYTIKVQYDNTIEDADGLLVIYVNDVEVYRNRNFGEFYGSLVGYRAAAEGTTFKSVEVKENEMPQDIQADVVGDFIVRNGKLAEENGALVAKQGQMLAVSKTKQMRDGTITAKMKAGAKGDNGIVFAMTEASEESFWEKGTSYYFFFINQNGCAHLGKVNNGGWKDCGVISAVNNYNVANEYTLKAEVNGGTIRCYVDGTLYITYTDEDFLPGTAVGIRAGITETTFRDFTVSAETIEHVKPTDYNIVSGDFEVIGNKNYSASANSMMISKSLTLETSGTISAKVVSGADSGIVFGVKDGGNTAFWEGEKDISYYFFFVNKVGAPILAKIAPTYKEIKSSTLSAMYASGTEYELRVVINEGVAYCYVGDRLMIKANVTLDGSGVGLRAAVGGIKFGDVTVTSSTDLVTADTLIIGHSYTEFWISRYQQDFYDVDDILDIGIGGTIAPNWLNLVDEVATYNPSTIIYMIGINDMSPWNGDNATGAKVSQIVFNTINQLHAKLPDAKIILINCNKVPMTEKVAYYDEIDKFNQAYAEFAAKEENKTWCKVVDFASQVWDSEKQQCNDALISGDTLHLSPSGYDVLTALTREAMGLDAGRNYRFVCGNGTYSEDGKITSDAGMLLINKTGEFTKGTIETTIKMDTLSDSGIVFGLSDGKNTYFWEGENGVSYYEFFLTSWNGVYLAKVYRDSKNELWHEIKSYWAGINAGQQYTLKVQWNGANIRCYVDGALYIDYTDSDPLTGDKYGYRAIGAGVQYGALTISDAITDTSVAPEGYDEVRGSAKVETVDGKKVITTLAPWTILSNNQATFTSGTLTADIKTVANTYNNGVIFGLNDNGVKTYWAEKTVSYYFLLINHDGWFILGKCGSTYEGGWLQAGSAQVSNFDINKTYTMKVEWNGSNIKCYMLDGATTVASFEYTETDTNFKYGSKYGYRTDASGVQFSEIAIHVCTFDQKVTTDDYLASKATCSEPATYYLSCTCGKHGTETFESGDKAPHTYSDKWSYDEQNHWHAATCEHTTEKSDLAPHTLVTGNDGYTQTCSICGYSPQHVHSFDQETVDPLYLASEATCQESAKYYKSCKCGQKGTETFSNGTTVDHSYTQETDEEKYLASEATCTEPAKYYKACKWCGLKGTETFNVGEANGHSFGEYTSDNNATALSDGTKTRTCSSCSKTETVTDEGSALYSVACGSGATESNGKIISGAGNTLLVNRTGEFKEGSISATIKMDTLSDSGIVFGLSDGGNTTYWETENGVSYYEFFLTSWNGVYLTKVYRDSNNTIWHEIKSYWINAAANKEYTLKVEWKGGNIRCYVDDQLFINYTDDSPLTGTKYGYRAMTNNVEYSEIVTSDAFSDITSLEGYDEVRGSAKVETVDGKKVITTLAPWTILSNNQSTFTNGTLTADIKTVANTFSNGIIFGLNDNGVKTYWAEDTVSYYFLLINHDGWFVLGKDGASSWQQLAGTQIGSFDINKTYTMKVQRNGSNIKCYMFDGATCVAKLDYTDASPLTGNKYGYRTEAKGVQFSEITITDSTESLVTAPTDYNAVSGSAVQTADGKVVSTYGATLLVNKSGSFESGTLTATIRPVAGKDNGIVFGLTDGGLTNYWEQETGVNYYFLFINLNGDLLLCKANPWSDVGNGGHIENFDANKTYTLKVEWNGNNIKCYAYEGTTCVAKLDATDANPLTGDKYGYRAQIANVEFGTITTSTEITED